MDLEFLCLDGDEDAFDPKAAQVSRIHLWNFDPHNLDKKSVPMPGWTFQIHLWNPVIATANFHPADCPLLQFLAPTFSLPEDLEQTMPVSPSARSALLALLPERSITERVECIHGVFCTALDQRHRPQVDFSQQGIFFVGMHSLHDFFPRACLISEISKDAGKIRTQRDTSMQEAQWHGTLSLIWDCFLNGQAHG